jgi:hypothetical protein
LKEHAAGFALRAGSSPDPSFIMPEVSSIALKKPLKAPERHGIF